MDEQAREKLVISQETLRGIAESSLRTAQGRMWQAQEPMLSHKAEMIFQGAVFNTLEVYFLDVAARLGNEFEIELVP